MMLRLIEEHPNDKILIILDAGKNTFRNTLYSEYKANRSEAPEDLIPQFGIIREAIDAFGLDVIEKKDFEADDVIASYVKLKNSEIKDFKSKSLFNKKKAVTKWEKDNTLDC